MNLFGNKKKTAIVAAPYGDEWAKLLCGKSGLDYNLINLCREKVNNHTITQNVLFELLKDPEKIDAIFLGLTHLGKWDLKKYHFFDGNKILKGEAETEEEKAAENFAHSLFDYKGLYTKYFANMRAVGDFLNHLTVIQKLCDRYNIKFSAACWERPFDVNLIHNYCKQLGKDHDRCQPPQPYWNFNYKTYFEWLVWQVTKVSDDPLFGKSAYDFLYGDAAISYRDRNPENPGWKFPVYMGLYDKSWLSYPQTEPGLLERLRSVSDGSDNDYKYFKDDLLNKDGHTRIAELYYEHYKKTYLENQN